jgi:hypothetical protein
MIDLPCDAAQLAAELSRPLVERDAYRLTVHSVAVTCASEPDAATLSLLVDAVPAPGARPERWQVDLPVSVEDLDPSVLHASLVTTLRANLEEWWATKGFDPVTQGLGRRLGDG